MDNLTVSTRSIPDCGVVAPIPTSVPLAYNLTQIRYPDAMDARATHELTWRAFNVGKTYVLKDGSTVTGKRDFVYRSDVGKYRGSLITNIVIITPVDRVTAWDLLPSGTPISTREIRSELALDDEYGFVVRTPPVRYIDLPMGQRLPGVRRDQVNIHGVEKQLEWFEEMGTKHGFEVLEVNPRNPTNMLCRVTQAQLNKGLRDWHYNVLDFAGSLRVTDPKRFQHALLAGIGKGKAFGCGLIALMNE